MKYKLISFYGTKTMNINLCSLIGFNFKNIKFKIQLPNNCDISDIIMHICARVVFLDPFIDHNYAFVMISLDISPLSPM